MTGGGPSGSGAARFSLAPPAGKRGAHESRVQSEVQVGCRRATVFFRISALLYGIPDNPRIGLSRMRRSGLARHPGAFGDYLKIGACVGDLNQIQFILLGEFYGPTCFAPRALPGA